MKHYQIFVIGYGGVVQSAKDILPVFIRYVHESDAFYDLKAWSDYGKINLELTYLVLPVFVAE